jgi:hypothetical protein
MRKLGNIRLAFASDKYQVQFQYATPQKIDFFALTLMEIIKRKKQFSQKTFSDVLLMLEIPEDLHNIFEDRVKTLVKEYPQMINFNYDVNCFIETEVSYFDLTPLGEETFISKEIIEETKSFSDEFIYEHSVNQLLNVRNATIQIENEAIVIDTRKDESEDILMERYTKIISNQITKFIPTANSKTKIFDMQIAPTNTVHLRDNIEVNLENGAVIFYHKSEAVLNAFLQLSEREKDSLRSKMFLYLNVPQTSLNMEMASIAVKRNQPLKIKVIFGNEKILKKEIFEKGIIELNDETKVYNIPNEEKYVFAGITENDRTIVFKYYEINQEGYTIPLLDEDYSNQNYLKVYNLIFEQYKESLSDINTIQFILTITPKDKLKEKIKIIADKNSNSNEIVNTLLTLNELETIEALELIKKYNQLLDQDKINSVSHKSNLYASYSDYSKKIDKLKSQGFEHYYSYIPVNWDRFIKEVRLLKPLFEKLKDKLAQEYKKSATDFFVRVEDDYYDLSPINEKAAKELAIGENWQSDITKALGISKPNFLAIAATIRGKYSEQLRKLEKQKDTVSDNSRQGKKLIEFVVKDYDKSNRVYTAWRNLCVLVHPETSSENRLINGSDSDRKIALTNAINIYNQILSEKKENTKNDNNKSNNKKKK